MNNNASFIRFLGRKLANYLGAVAVAYLLAAISSTQSVIASLSHMGVAVPLDDRLSMTLHDIAGMAAMFLPMVAFALLVAFMTAALLSRWISRWRPMLYAVAGAAAVVSIHLLLHLAFSVTPIAIARTGVGLLIQGIAGAAGGLTYLFLSLQTQKKPPAGAGG